jgi:hypothetical protein
VNFYAPDDLRAWIEEDMRRAGQSKTQVIAGAPEEVQSPDQTRTSLTAYLQGFLTGGYGSAL